MTRSVQEIAQLLAQNGVPAPLTAEGLIDEGRLRRALEAKGYKVSYYGLPEHPAWEVYADWSRGLWHTQYGDPDLALAALKALGSVEEV